MAETNPCPEGIPFMQGRWRFVGESRTRDFHDVLSIDGTAFSEVMSGRPDGGGEHLEARVEGQIRCLFDNRILMTTERVTPPGAFGNRVGDAYPCDILNEISGRTQRVLLLCFFDWDLRSAAGKEFEYQRIASEPK